MINFSRRCLAKYAVDAMLAKRSAVDLSAHLAAALITSRRQKEVELLLSDIDLELEDRGLLVKARVTSAYPLSLGLKRNLASRLRGMTAAREIILQEQTDKDIVGGLKIETASHTWDKTLLRTLAKLKGTA